MTEKKRMLNRKILTGILYFILVFQLSALNIVKDQKAMAIIVTRNNPSVLELIPARTVQEYVKKITGVELPTAKYLSRSLP